MTAVARYSSKFSRRPFVHRSSVLRAKPPRNTQFWQEVVSHADTRLEVVGVAARKRPLRMK